MLDLQSRQIRTTKAIRKEKTDKPADKSKLNSLAIQLKKDLADHRFQLFKEYISKLSQTQSRGKSLRQAPKFVNHQKQNDALLKNHLGNWTTSDEEKANTLVLHLAVIPPNPPIGKHFSPLD